jgi:hypothetical protein
MPDSTFVLCANAFATFPTVHQVRQASHRQLAVWADELPGAATSVLIALPDLNEENAEEETCYRIGIKGQILARLLEISMEIGLSQGSSA